MNVNEWGPRKAFFYALEVMGFTMLVASLWVAPWWAALIVGAIGYIGRWKS